MNNLAKITSKGQSIWFDDLRRDLLTSGTLEDLVIHDSVTGVTTNPTILAKAVSGSSDYDQQLEALARAGASTQDAYVALVTTDIQGACDVLYPVWEATGGADGFVSVEVSPGVANDTAATIQEAREWVKRIDRENLLVKVPATDEGAFAFEELTAEGISINVTLIFSLARYRDIAERYLSGIERFIDSGGDPSKVHSVASFFVSRVDTEVDARLKAFAPLAKAARLRGKAGVANARVAYGIFVDLFTSDRWEALAARGATVQRPLWASTGVKDPAYPDTMYVDSLVAPQTVNTMPLATLRAVANHGEPEALSAEEVSSAPDLLAALEWIGVDFRDVITTIEREGLEKFSASYDDLMSTLTQRLRHGE